MANSTVDSPEFLVNIPYPENKVYLNDFEKELKTETTYYWRVDAIDDSSVVTNGDVWYFKTEAAKFDVQIKVLDAGSNDLISKVLIDINGHAAITNTDGIAELPEVLPGSYDISLIHRNYF